MQRRVATELGHRKAHGATRLFSSLLEKGKDCEGVKPPLSLWVLHGMLQPAPSPSGHRALLRCRLHDTDYTGSARPSNCDKVKPFFAFEQDIRRAIYTTNAIEALNRQIWKAIKTRGQFPNDQAAFKVIYLALDRASKRWTMPIKRWGQTLQQFAIHFPDRGILK
jgi:hypothetical protein